MALGLPMVTCQNKAIRISLDASTSDQENEANSKGAKLRHTAADQETSALRASRGCQAGFD